MEENLRSRRWNKKEKGPRVEKIHSKNLRPIVQDALFLTYFFYSPSLWSVKSKLQKPGQSHSLQERAYTTVPKGIIIHQTHYEKSDWSRAFNQLTIACELDMINAISAADIAFIMSSSTSAWLLSPLECSPQKQNGWTLHFCFWGWIMWKMCNETII